MSAATVSREIPSVSVARKGQFVACRELPITDFFSNVLGNATLKNLNSETCDF